MTVIGFERSDFTPRGTDTRITGYNVFLARGVDPTKGKGTATERIYLTDARLAACGFELDKALGKNVTIMYSRYGKPVSIALMT